MQSIASIPDVISSWCIGFPTILLYLLSCQLIQGVFFRSAGFNIIMRVGNRVRSGRGRASTQVVPEVQVGRNSKHEICIGGNPILGS